MQIRLTSLPVKKPHVRSAVLRLVVFFVVQVAALIGAQWVVQEVARGNAPAMRGVAALGAALLLSAALSGVYVALVRTLEHRALKEWLPRYGLGAGGALIGVTIFCITYAVLWGLGEAQWLGFTRPTGLLAPLASAILAGVGEELAFRGGVFRILEESVGTALALALSAALFGGVHAVNHGATWVSTVAIALEAGVLLGAAYAAARSLWLPIGVHIGWNFAEGGLFGAAVSGSHLRQGLVHMPLAGPYWMTGGAFGPEASVVAVGVCLSVAAALITLTVRSGRWVPLHFNGVRTARAPLS